MTWGRLRVEGGLKNHLFSPLPKVGIFISNDLLETSDGMSGPSSKMGGGLNSITCDWNWLASNPRIRKSACGRSRIP